MTGKYKVYIVDDDEAVRHSLQLLMKSSQIPAETYDSAISFLEKFNPDQSCVVLADVRMPGMSGLELQQELVNRKADLPVIIMTGHGDIAMAVSAMKAGAADFIEKPFKNQELLDKIQLCINQADEMHRDQQWQAEVAQRLRRLSSREKEVMDLMVAGKLNKQIAAELDISIRTVEAHRAKIMYKLEARSLPDVVRIALLV